MGYITQRISDFDTKPAELGPDIASPGSALDLAIEPMDRESGPGAPHYRDLFLDGQDAPGHQMRQP